MSGHSEFYNRAEWYDLAFDFRNIAKECDFLTEIARVHTGRPPASFIEFAAGPARHALEFAKRGCRSSAMDLSDEMRTYSSGVAARQGISLTYLCEDIVRFEMKERFDLAAIMMNSTAYILSNDDFVAHLRSVANALSENGVYVLEMDHPRDIYKVGRSTTDDWEMEKDGRKVSLSWGSKDDPFDPVSGIAEVTAKMRCSEGGREFEIVERDKQRLYTVNEIKALVQLSEEFEIVALLGALSAGVALSNAKESWRTVVVLKKIAIRR